jgi:hypothetical protein
MTRPAILSQKSTFKVDLFRHRKTVRRFTAILVTAEKRNIKQLKTRKFLSSLFLSWNRASSTMLRHASLIPILTTLSANIYAFIQKGAFYQVTQKPGGRASGAWMASHFSLCLTGSR